MEYIWDNLTLLDINVDVGVGFFSGNRQQYMSILKEFCYGAQKRKEAIEEFMCTRDWHNYVIAVHALKSTAKNIGALKLSDMAANLEQQAKEEKYDNIVDNTPELLEKFEALYAGLKPYCHENVAEKQPVDKPQIQNLLKALIAAAEDFDFMSAEELIEDLNGYDFNEKETAQMQIITHAMRELDYQGCAEAAREFQNESYIL